MMSGIEVMILIYESYYIHHYFTPSPRNHLIWVKYYISISYTEYTMMMLLIRFDTKNVYIHSMVICIDLIIVLGRRMQGIWRPYKTKSNFILK